MVILGIDPGYATVGYGIIDSTGSNNKVIDYGVITTPKEQKLPARLKHISECVKELIAKHKPNAICVEELFFKATERRLFCGRSKRRDHPLLHGQRHSYV